MMLGVLLLVEVLGALEHTMVLTALPAILREYRDLGLVGWIVTGFALMQAAVAAVAAPLGDVFGRRKLLIIVISLCAVGSLISVFGSNLHWVILGRALQGASGAILPLCYGVIREALPDRKAPFWIGVMTGAALFAAGLGFVVGGYLADLGDWRWIFRFTAVLAILAVPLLIAFLPSDAPAAGERRQLDVVGAIVFAPAAASVLYGVTLAKDLGWMDLKVLMFVLAGLALMVGWVLHELRHPAPLIDVRLLRRPQIAAGNICAALACLGTMQLPFLTLMYLQQPVVAGVGLGATAMMAGLFKVPSNISALIASPISGWLAGRNGALWAALWGASICALGWLLLTFFNKSLWEVLACTIVAAFGSSMLLAALPNMVLVGAPRERTSEVTGLLSVVKGLCLAIGAQTLTLILASSRVAAPGLDADFPSAEAYMRAFGFVAVLSAGVAVVVAVLILRDRRVAHAMQVAE